MSQRSPSRSWCFTVFAQDFGEDLVALWPVEGVRYIVCQRERCPETARLHWQGYVETERPCRFSWFRDRGWPSGSHFERRRGTRDEARDYCRKEDTRDANTHPLELGSWLTGGQGSRSDLTALRDRVRAAVTDGATGTAIQDILYEDFFAAAIRYDRGISRYVARAIRRPRPDPPRVVVYQGATGTGKTRKFFEDHQEDHWRAPAATSGSQLWFDGYTGQKAVLFDDYDGAAIKLPLLLQLCDRYPLDVPVKGGFAYFCPMHIVFTTNVPVDRWYDGANVEQRAALERRITEV